MSKCEVEGCKNESRYELYHTVANGRKKWIKVCRLHEGKIGNENMAKSKGQGGKYEYMVKAAAAGN